MFKKGECYGDRELRNDSIRVIRDLTKDLLPFVDSNNSRERLLKPDV